MYTDDLSIGRLELWGSAQKIQFAGGGLWRIESMQRLSQIAYGVCAVWWQAITGGDGTVSLGSLDFPSLAL